MTFSEEIKASDAVLIVRLGRTAEGAGGCLTANRTATPLLPTTPRIAIRNRPVAEVAQRSSSDPNKLKCCISATTTADTQFLIFGTDPKEHRLEHADRPSPTRTVKYIARSHETARVGKRTGWPFFQDYFEDKDPLLATDSYDEFAKALIKRSRN